MIYCLVLHLPDGVTKWNGFHPGAIGWRRQLQHIIFLKYHNKGNAYAQRLFFLYNNIQARPSNVQLKPKIWNILIICTLFTIFEV